MKRIITIAVLLLSLVSFSSCSNKEIAVGTTKKEVLKSLGEPHAWYVLKPGAGLTVVSFFSPGSTEREMPEDEIWFFEYEKPNLCIWLKGGTVTEVKKEPCTKGK